jgi:hypothetical protein
LLEESDWKMSADLEKIFGPDLLAALDERIRSIARQERGAAGDDWLSYAQIVELTGLSEWTIGEAVRRGELEADYPRPRCPRVKRSKLREWMERRSDDEGGADIPARRAS